MVAIPKILRQSVKGVKYIIPLGCVNCDEAAYIDEQREDRFADQLYDEPPPDHVPTFETIVPRKVAADG